MITRRGYRNIKPLYIIKSAFFPETYTSLIVMYVFSTFFSPSPPITPSDALLATPTARSSLPLSFSQNLAIPAGASMRADHHASSVSVSIAVAAVVAVAG